MNRLDDTHPVLDQLVAFGIGGVPGEAATAIEEPEFNRREQAPW